MDYTQFLINKYPFLSDADAENIYLYVKEIFCDVLQTEDIPQNKQYTFLQACYKAVELGGMLGYENFSENGLSIVIDKQALVRDIVPKIRKIKGKTNDTENI